MSKLNSRDELIPGKAYKVKGVMFLCQCLLPAKYDSMYNKSVANPDDILTFEGFDTLGVFGGNCPMFSFYDKYNWSPSWHYCTQPMWLLLSNLEPLES